MYRPLIPPSLSASLFALHAVLCASAQDPNVVGAWVPEPTQVAHPLKLSDPGTQFWRGTQGIHAVLLPNDRILVWGTLTNPSDPNIPDDDCDVLLINPYDPTNAQCVAERLGTTLDPNDPNDPTAFGHDWFCSGVAHLSTGDLFLAGGGDASGLTSVYRPSVTNPPGAGKIIKGQREYWSYDPNTPQFVWRFYPTVTTLANGKALVIDGNTYDYHPESGYCCYVAQPQTDTPLVWTIPDPNFPFGWSFEPLNEAKYRVPERYNFELTAYPFMFVTPGGVFQAGGNEIPCYQNFAMYKRSRMLNTALKTWAHVTGDPNNPNSEPDDIPGASAVMFAPHLIMKAGGLIALDPGSSCSGGSGPIVKTTTHRAQKIDLNHDNPAWTELAPLDSNVYREWMYLVPLPNGRILASGGGQKNGNQLWWPEMYDPNTDSWAPMAELNEERSHHHASILCRDGSVYVGGGDDNKSHTSHNKTYRFFRPPYFFWGPRPAITSAPEEVYYGEAFNISVTTQTAGGIVKVRLIRPGAATHSFDHSTRMMELAFTSPSAGALRIAAPANADLAPPGYYLLFVAENKNGGTGGNFPSEGAFVKLGNNPS